MDKFEIPIQVQWSNLDPNRHLRHSAYYDYGATTRIAFFYQHGLTNSKPEELRIGPILFHEEALFKREIRFEDSITVDLLLTKSTHDFARWTCNNAYTKQIEPWPPSSNCMVVGLTWTNDNRPAQ